jgi:hypothetical protein
MSVRKLTAPVFGDKDHFVLAVIYLFIGGQNFWQVVMCARERREFDGRSRDSGGY